MGVTWKRVGMGVLVVLVVGGGLYYLFGPGGSVSSPAPQPGGPSPVLEELPPSLLNIPVEYSMDLVPQMLEDAVPMVMGDLGDRRNFPAASGVEYAFQVERESFQAQVVGDTIRVATTLHYQAQAWYDPPFLQEITGSCGRREAERPRARIVLASPVEVDEEWRLRTNLRVERLEPLSSESRDRCRVSDFNVDLTELVMEGARGFLDQWASEADAAVASLDLREQLSGYWEQLLEPVPVGEGFWLVLDPRGVRIGDIRPGEGERVSLRTTLAVQLSPRIVSGGRPSPSEQELPQLERGAAPGDSRVAVEARADYGTITELAARTLEGREFEAGGRTIRVRHASVHGVGDGRVALELDLAGALQGRVFLVGTPVYDSDRNEVTVPDLDFHVDTRNVLSRAAGWVLQTRFLDRIRREARFPVDPLLLASQAIGPEGIRYDLAPGVWLEGGLTDLEVTRVAALPDAMVVRSEVLGSLHLRIDDRQALAE